MEGEGGIEGSLVVAALSVDFIFLQLAQTGKFLVPVGRPVLEQGSREIILRGRIVGGEAGVDGADPPVFEELAARERAEVPVVDELRHTVFGAGREFGLAHLAALGRHEDDAVRGAGAVDRSRSRILQDGDGLDVVRVDEGGGGTAAHTHVGKLAEVFRHHGDAVDDPEGLVAGVDGGGTTDTDRGSGTGLAGSGGDGHTGHLTGEHLIDRSRRDRSELLVLHGRDATRVGLAADRSVSDDDGVLEELCVRFQRDVDLRPPVDRDFLRFIRHQTDDEDAVPRHGDLEVTEVVGLGVRGSTPLQQHGRVVQRLAIGGIRHGSRDRPRLSKCRAHAKHEAQQQRE